MSERNKTLALIGGIGIVMLLITAIGYAFITGRAIDTFAPTLFGFAIPIVTTLLLGAGIGSQLKDVHDKVNGNYSKQAEIIAQQGTQIKQLLSIVTPEQGQTVLDSTGELPVIEQDTEGKHSR